MSPGDSAVITYTVTVNNPDTGDKQVINTVDLRRRRQHLPARHHQQPLPCATVPVLTPALTIVKTASAASATPGQHVTYTITVTDTGQTPYTGAVVTDDLTGLLDDAAYGADAAATRGAVSYASPVLTWTGNLTPGQAATITYTVTVDNPETGDNILTNTVTSTASGSNCRRRIHRPPLHQHRPGGHTDIVNTANVGTTTPGGRIDYTITITNTGQTRYEQRHRHRRPDRCHRRQRGLRQRRRHHHRLDQLRQPEPDLDRRPGTRPVRHRHLLGHRQQPRHRRQDHHQHHHLRRRRQQLPGRRPPTPACTSTVTVLIPALTITKTASTTTTTPGSTVGYTVTVTDTGPTPYTAATVTDTSTAY